MMAMAGLNAGLQWLKAQGWEKLLTRRRELVHKLRFGLLHIGNGKIEIVGDVASTKESIPMAIESDQVTGAVSIVAAAPNTDQQVSMQDLNQHLKESADIVASLGFQCSPLGHEALGTSQSGTLRFSVGVVTTDQEIERLLVEIQKFLG